MTAKTAQYSLCQHYEVTIDEQGILEELSADHRFPSEEFAHDVRERYLRLHRAIVANHKAVDAVITYLMLAEQGAKGGSSYVSQYYDDADYELINILVEHKAIFAPEDQEWIDGLMEEARDPEKEVDIAVEMDPLSAGFKLMPSGFHVGHAR